jgi:hypothetical protein
MGVCNDYSLKYDWCIATRAKCERMCADKKVYGAIAYSARDKGAGWSYGWDDQGTAEKVALSNCSKRGTACKLVIWFYNSCGAVAADGSIVTWGRDSRKAGAQQIALDECVKAGGNKCALQASQCSFK